MGPGILTLNLVAITIMVDTGELTEEKGMQVQPTPGRGEYRHPKQNSCSLDSDMNINSESLEPTIKLHCKNFI